MTKEELETKIKQITAAAAAEIKQIKKDYAMERNTYKIGDVISDGATKIKVERIFFYQSMDSLFYCKYVGVKLKKDNTPFKNRDKADIYQENIIK